MTSNVAVVFISVAMIVVVVVVEVVVVWCIIKRCDVYIYSYDRYDVNEHRCRAFRLSRSSTFIFFFHFIHTFPENVTRGITRSPSRGHSARTHKQQTEAFDLLLAGTRGTKPFCVVVVVVVVVVIIVLFNDVKNFP